MDKMIGRALVEGYTAEVMDLKFPEVEALRGVQQDPLWHPEGDAYTHTAWVVREAVRHFRIGMYEHDLVFVLSAYLHDIGKRATFALNEAGVPCFHKHGEVSASIAGEVLKRIGADPTVARQVVELVRLHSAPYSLPADSKDEAYRRILRSLAEAGTNVEMLSMLALADSWGRGTPDALAHDKGPIPEFLRRATEVLMKDARPKPVVLGRHLVERGMSPGPEFGAVLARCYEYQISTGDSDPNVVLKAVLG